MDLSRIYQIERPTPPRISEVIKELAEDGRHGAQITLYRMWVAGQEKEQELLKKECFIEHLKRNCFITERVRCNTEDIILLDEQYAVVKIFQKDDNETCGYIPVCLDASPIYCYKSLDEALVRILCMKYDNADSYKYLAKILGMDIR